MKNISCKRDERDTLEYKTLQTAQESCLNDPECGCIADWKCDNETFYTYKGTETVVDSVDCSWIKIASRLNSNITGTKCPSEIVVHYPIAVSRLKDKFGTYRLKYYDGNENGIYEHNGNFLFKTKENDSWWMVSNIIFESHYGIDARYKLCNVFYIWYHYKSDR